MEEISDYNVLVVDDTEANVDILVDTLSDSYDISVAMDGPSALEAVSENPPDLILLDVMMPGMDGYEVCERLKANKRTRGIPVIFVTAKVEVADEIKGFGSGAVDYVTKPISPPVVKARVETHLKLRKAERDLQELVEKTLAGAVGVLVDILSVANPTAFSRASRIKRHVNELMAASDLSRFWQIRLAATLSQIGCITVSSEIIEKIYRGQDVSREERETYSRHPQVGYEMICKLPNLGEVAEIIARQQILETDTGFQGTETAQKLIQVGSRMLKLVLDYEQLTYSGETPNAAISKLKSAEGIYGPKLLEKFSRIIEIESPHEDLQIESETPQDAQDQSESAHKGIRELRAGDLTPGMIIARDIFTKKGILLIKADTEVNLVVYETLHNFSKTDFVEEPFQVFDS